MWTQRGECFSLVINNSSKCKVNVRHNNHFFLSRFTKHRKVSYSALETIRKAAKEDGEFGEEILCIDVAETLEQRALLNNCNNKQAANTFISRPKHWRRNKHLWSPRRIEEGLCGSLGGKNNSHGQFVETGVLHAYTVIVLSSFYTILTTKSENKKRFHSSSTKRRNLCIHNLIFLQSCNITANFLFFGKLCEMGF